MSAEQDGLDLAEMLEKHFTHRGYCNPHHRGEPLVHCDTYRAAALALDLRGEVADAWDLGWCAGVARLVQQHLAPVDNPHRAALADQPEQVQP